VPIVFRVAATKGRFLSGSGLSAAPTSAIELDFSAAVAALGVSGVVRVAVAHTAVGNQPPAAKLLTGVTNVMTRTQHLGLRRASRAPKGCRLPSFRRRATAF
jgi:hypothetical protein